MNKFFGLLALCLFLLSSCASKKSLHYFQNIKSETSNSLRFEAPKVQPNDILDIKVSALVPETTLPYNRQVATTMGANSLELLKLQGYLVANDGTIKFPVLGEMKVDDLSPKELEAKLELELEEGGHLVEPTVSVRLLNAKFSVLGEVQRPGTYNFTEQHLTLPQALGYAGDLTINGIREDVLLIREEWGERRVTHLDLTTTDWFNSPYFFVKPNDVIVVNPNTAKVKSAGVVGNAGTVLTIFSLILSSVVILTR